MTTSDQLWIGQNGKRYGPYTEALVRQWQAESKLDADALAWREGMPEWVLLSDLLPLVASQRPPPASKSTYQGSYALEPLAARDSAGKYAESDPADLPPPPSLHWGLVLLFTMLSFGIFSIVWSFIQASWIRKIDLRSGARLMLTLSITGFVVGEILSVSSTVLLHAGQPGIAGILALVGGLLLLGYIVLYIAAYFSMANSLRRGLAPYGLPVAIGGVTLFFFTVYYLQGQLRWIAHWKADGRTVPKAPKATLWLLFGVPMVVAVIAILAAIAIPAYQSYLVRSQVSMSWPLSEGAKKAFADYYAAHHVAPPDNAAAGLASSAAITNQYVSGIDVSGGRITVAFNTPRSNVTIRDKVLVLTPTTDAGEMRWSCSEGTTVPARDLPPACRR